MLWGQRCQCGRCRTAVCSPGCLLQAALRSTPAHPHSPALHPNRYVHRVGRTGRAGQSGVAISLLAPSDAAFAADLAAMLAEKETVDGDAPQQQQQQGQPPAVAVAADDSSSDDEEGAAGGSGRGGGGVGGLQPHQRITKAAVEGLRYRAEDVARSITKNVIKEVRPGYCCWFGLDCSCSR